VTAAAHIPLRDPDPAGVAAQRARPVLDTAGGNGRVPHRPAAGQRPTVDNAAHVPALHRDWDGLCAGCHSEYGHLETHPCEQARCAANVRAQGHQPDVRRACRYGTIVIILRMTQVGDIGPQPRQALVRVQGLRRTTIGGPDNER
jgi:hypothetical protein